MRRIEKSSLWIGNVRDAQDARGLFDHGIQAVVDLALEEPPTRLPRELTYCRFPLSDGAGNPPWLLHAAIDMTARLARARVTALVFCSMGMSRSPAIIAAALALTGDHKPDEYLAAVLASGPADVAPGLWHDVLDVLESIQPSLSMPGSSLQKAP
jgi:hypothetical protein